MTFIQRIFFLKNNNLSVVQKGKEGIQKVTKKTKKGHYQPFLIYIMFKILIES